MLLFVQVPIFKNIKPLFLNIDPISVRAHLVRDPMTLCERCVYQLPLGLNFPKTKHASEPEYLQRFAHDHYTLPSSLKD